MLFPVIENLNALRVPLYVSLFRYRFYFSIAQTPLTDVGLFLSPPFAILGYDYLFPQKNWDAVLLARMGRTTPGIIEEESFF